MVWRAIAWTTASRFFERCESSRMTKLRWLSCSTCAVMSVLVPNQRATRPWLSRSGITRVRNGRNTPSAPLSGNVMSNGSPPPTDSCQRAVTSGSTAGSCTRCQPSPSICSGVVPVYSYQRSLYQTIQPSEWAIQTSCGIELASVRNCASRSCSAASARRRSEMSRVILQMPITVPSVVRIGAASNDTSTRDAAGALGLEPEILSGAHGRDGARDFIHPLGRNDQVDGLADRLFGRVTIELLGRLVPRQDGAVEGQALDRVGRGGDHRGQMGVRHLGLL